MKLTLLVFLFVIAIVHSEPVTKQEEDDWKLFKEKHKKSYESVDDEDVRKNIFVKNKRMIDAHNKDFDDGLVTFDLALNRHADKTSEEFFAKHTGFNLDQAQKKLSQSAVTNTLSAVQATTDKCNTTSNFCDWKISGYVTPVKDQGQCGSCWAFSANGAVEFAYFKKYGKVEILSEQNLVDCVTASSGCNGGYMTSAFEYMMKNKMSLEATYKYLAVQNACNVGSTTQIDTTVSNYVNVNPTESDLQKAVYDTAVSIGFHVEGKFQFYKSGVYISNKCKATMINHGMLAIGYATENGQDYWLIKNSWGSSWGDSGFIKVARNRRNMCGIASMASYPVLG